MEQLVRQDAGAGQPAIASAKRKITQQSNHPTVKSAKRQGRASVMARFRRVVASVAVGARGSCAGCSAVPRCKDPGASAASTLLDGAVRQTLSQDAFSRRFLKTLF
jgi:hypothetical protein